MKRTRWGLVVACLSVVAAAFAVAGGNAGNRTGQPTLEVVPGPAAVSYGENIAYTATFFNDTNSMFTQVRFVMAPPSGPGAGDVATPVRTSCGTFDPVTKVLTCNFGQLPPGEANKLTVTVVWKAPEGASKPGCENCFAGTGTWFIKEGKETNGNETFGLTRFASLIGVDDEDPAFSNRTRAGGYELKGCATAGETNLATNANLDATTNPVVSSFCLPASFQPTSAAGGVASTITEPSGGPSFARQSLICIAAPGQNCPDGSPATFGGQFILFTFKVADSALPPGYKITQVFHNSTTTALPKCKPVDTDNTDPNGCVVSIDPPKGPGIKTWTIVTKAKTNGPWSW